MKSVTRPAQPRRFTRRIPRTALLLLAVGAFSLLAPRNEPTLSSARGPAEQDAVAGIRPETRLRKLHLVRPDLIPYPIAYEVYC